MSLVQTQQTLSLPKIKAPNRIPIVQHLIRDNDIYEPEVKLFKINYKHIFSKLFNFKFLKGEELKAIEFEKVIKIFLDPHSVIYQFNSKERFINIL